MNCTEFDEQVALLLDEAACPAIERALRDHVSECQSCSARLKEMQGVQALLLKSVIPAPSDALDARVMRSFQNRSLSFTASQPWWRGWLRIRRPALAMTLVSIVAALVLGFAVGRMSVRRDASPSAAIATSATPSSPKPADIRETQNPPPPPQTVFKSGTERRKPVSRRPLRMLPARERPLESVTVVSPAGANYTTRAALDGFEPITGTKLRVIKPGEEK